MKKVYKIIVAIFITIIILFTASIMTMAVKRPVLTIETVEAKPGDTVDVKVSISGNSGIARELIEVSYDTKLILVKAENGTAFSNLTYTEPRELGNPSKFLWNGEKDVSKKDGTVLKLRFKVPDNAEKGTVLNIKVAARHTSFSESALNRVNSESDWGLLITADNEELTFKNTVNAIANAISELKKNVDGILRVYGKVYVAENYNDNKLNSRILLKTK